MNWKGSPRVSCLAVLIADDLGQPRPGLQMDAASFDFACQHGDYPVRLSFLLLILVIAQGLFGMWTVTLKLLPAVVAGHLLGGLMTLTLLILLAGKLRPMAVPGTPSRGRWVMRIAVLVLFIDRKSVV